MIGCGATSRGELAALGAPNLVLGVWRGGRRQDAILPQGLVPRHAAQGVPVGLRAQLKGKG